MHDFCNITEIHVRFSEHPSFPQAHTHLNNLYSDVMPNFPRVFLNRTTCHAVIDDAALLALISNVIVNEMIFPYATETLGAHHIAHVFNDLALRVEITGGPTTMTQPLSTAALTEALHLACSDPIYYGNICITIPTHGRSIL